MEWIQVLTIVITIISALFAAIFYIHRENKEMWQKHDADMKEMRQKSDIDMKEMRQGFSKFYDLWGSVLREIHTIEKQILDIKLHRTNKS